MKYILLHGMGQTASSWDKLTSYFPESSEAVRPELSAFFTEGCCLYSEIYANFCEYCGSFSEKINLCGLSLGAVLALNYSIDFPQMVNSLVLIAPQYKMPKFLLKMQNVIFRFMPESSFKEIGFTKKDFITLTNSMADLDFTYLLKRVTRPVLILCGEKDNANKKAAMKLAEALPNARFGIIKNSRHEVNADNPQELANRIFDAEAFLNEKA